MSPIAKETGLGWTTFSVDDSGGTPRAIVNDVHSLSFSTPIAVQDVTGLDKSAIERLHLLRDFSSTANGIFNDAAAPSSHDTFTPLSNARTQTMVVSGQTLAPEVLLTDYALTRGEGGELTWVAPSVLADGTVPTWS